MSISITVDVDDLLCFIAFYFYDLYSNVKFLLIFPFTVN